MKLRAMEEQDVRAVANLEKVCFSDPWTEEMFTDGLRLPFFVGAVVEESGEIIAYACETVLFEDAEVLNIAVAPNYRKMGIAKMLLTHLEERAKALGASRSLLEVRVGNTAAISLYRLFSYHEISVRKKYYEDGEDALVMEKTLS